MHKQIRLRTDTDTDIYTDAHTPYTLYTTHFTLHTTHYTHYTLCIHIKHYTLHTTHYTLHTMHIHYTLYTIHGIHPRINRAGVVICTENNIADGTRTFFRITVWT